jgi:hypothetical protein
VIYDESSKTLAARELAVLSFRRNMEAAMVATLSGGLALAIVLPMRLHVPDEALPFVVAFPPALILLMEGLLFWLRRSPPTAAVERFSQVIETKRAEGAPVGALSRTFIALTGVLALAFAVGLLLVIPIA